MNKSNGHETLRVGSSSGFGVGEYRRVKADGIADRSAAPSNGEQRMGNKAGTAPAADSAEERDLAKRNAPQADLDHYVLDLWIQW